MMLAITLGSSKKIVASVAHASAFFVLLFAIALTVMVISFYSFGLELSLLAVIVTCMSALKLIATFFRLRRHA